MNSVETAELDTNSERTSKLVLYDQRVICAFEKNSQSLDRGKPEDALRTIQNPPFQHRENAKHALLY